VTPRKVEVEDQEDQREGERQHERHARAHPLEQLVLPRPLQRVASRKFHFALDRSLGVVDVPADVAALEVDVDPAGE
jgi:hypothetical protein